MKILLIGLGSIGRRHLQNLAAKGVTQLAVLRSGKSTIAMDGLPSHQTFTQLDEALAWKPTAVFICNPTSLHMKPALAAARAGCHLFMEKPISHTLDGVDELEKLVNKNKLLVYVGFQFRHHPVLQQIRAYIQEGKLGKIVAAQAHWGEYLPAWHPWEDYRNSYSAREDLGGGVILTLCHPFDYLRWLLGEVQQVQAIGGHLSSLELQSEDVALINLKFEQGAVGSVYLDYVSRPPKHTLQLIGDEGRIEWDALSGTAEVFLAGEKTAILTAPESFERNKLFESEVAEFLDCLQNHTQPSCTLFDGIQALKIAQAAKSRLRVNNTNQPHL